LKERLYKLDEIYFVLKEDEPL